MILKTEIVFITRLWLFHHRRWKREVPFGFPLRKDPLQGEFKQNFRAAVDPVTHGLVVFCDAIKEPGSH